MGMLETYNYEEVNKITSILVVFNFPLIRHCIKQPIIFCSMMFVTHWFSCTQCHRGDCPLTLQTVLYVIDSLWQFPILLVKAMLSFSGRNDPWIVFIYLIVVFCYQLWSLVPRVLYSLDGQYPCRPGVTIRPVLSTVQQPSVHQEAIQWQIQTHPVPEDDLSKPPLLHAI